MKCPNCNSEFKDGMKFCPKCGAEMPQKRYCPECGTELKDGLRFCPQCGRAMVEQSFVISNHKNSYEPINETLQSNSSNSYLKRALIFISVIAVSIVLFGVLPNLFQESSHSNYTSTNENSSEYSKYSDELANAENELQMASNALNEVLPYYQAVIAQYGGGQMAVIAASQNNPQLFRNFDDAESRYERCFEKVASIYDKMGYRESGDAYREELRNWRTKVRRMKGMY